MSTKIKIKTILLLVAVSTLAIGQAHATNGYFAHGYSVKDKGMAGAGVAYSTDTLAAATNPAGMVLQGERYDIGGAIFSPRRSYTVTGGPSLPPGTACSPNCPFSIGDGSQSIDSDNEAFLIPQYGQNWMLDSESSIGLSIYGNGGMNTEYKGGTAILNDPLGTPNNVQLPGTYGAGTAGVDLAQLFITTTYSRKISDTASWGISGIVAYQTFEATGMSNFGGFSLAPSKLSNNGGDSATGIGIRLGIQGEVAPGITLGASIQPEIDMGEFDKYAGLFAENGDFDIPSTWTIGLAWQISASRVFQIDVQQINYEDVAAVSNPILPLADGSCIPGPFGGTGAECLGGANGAGYGWEDMTIVKLGYEWQNTADWTWRLGYSFGDQPIPETEMLFNITAPGVMEDHFTFGFTRALDSKSSFNFAFLYAPSVDVSGANTFDPAQTIKLEMDQYEVALSYSKTF
ncbi:MAG: outer membrane protein transport protein [Gammaproteobacteria bacterium]